MFNFTVSVNLLGETVCFLSTGPCNDDPIYAVCFGHGRAVSSAVH